MSAASICEERTGAGGTNIMATDSFEGNQGGGVGGPSKIDGEKKPKVDLLNFIGMICVGVNIVRQTDLPRLHDLRFENKRPGQQDCIQSRPVNINQVRFNQARSQ